MEKKNSFNTRISDIAKKSQAMRNLCIGSQFDANTGAFLTDDAGRQAAITLAISNDPMFESAGMSLESSFEIVSGMQSAIREYEQIHGELPRDEVLASAYQTMGNMMMLEGKSESGSIGEMMLESIGQSLSTSEGVEIRAKMIGLVLPVLLDTATLDAVTMMPAGANEVEIFKVYRITGSNFGDFAAGTEIDQATVGQYTNMRQRYEFAEAQRPDGTKTSFSFDSATDLKHTKTPVPFRKGYVSLFIDRKRVARDMDSSSGLLTGQFTKADGTKVIINGQVDYAKGKVEIALASGGTLPEGTELHIEFEVDIEKSPELIPVIDHEMDSVKIRPSQRAVAADASIQAMFTMQREYSQDLKSMQMSHMRNTLAAEKATGHLVDMNFCCTTETTFNLYVAAGEDWKLHRERLNETLLAVSTEILQKTKTSGLVGIYAGTQACNWLKSLGAPSFVAPANYRQKNSIHYAGKLFGMWKVFECPTVIGTNEMLCYGRGSGHSEAGYVAGDAIAATMYTHPIGKNLKASNTLYELSYGEVHPYNGEDYFYRVILVDEAPKEVEAA